MSCFFSIKDSNVKYNTEEDLLKFIDNNNFFESTSGLRMMSRVDLLNLVNYYKYYIGEYFKYSVKVNSNLTLDSFKNSEISPEHFIYLRDRFIIPSINNLPDGLLKTNLTKSLDYYRDFVSFFVIYSGLKTESEFKSDDFKEAEEETDDDTKVWIAPEDRRGDNFSHWDLAPADIKYLFSLLPKTNLSEEYIEDLLENKNDADKLKDAVEIVRDSQGNPILINPSFYLINLIKEFEGLSSTQFEQVFYSDDILIKYPEIYHLRQMLPPLNTIDNNGNTRASSMNESAIMIRLSNYLIKPIVNFKKGSTTYNESTNSFTYQNKQLIYSNFFKVKNRFINNANTFSKDSDIVKNGYVRISESNKREYIKIIDNINKLFSGFIMGDEFANSFSPYMKNANISQKVKNEFKKAFDILGMDISDKIFNTSREIFISAANHLIKVFKPFNEERDIYDEEFLKKYGNFYRAFDTFLKEDKSGVRYSNIDDFINSVKDDRLKYIYKKQYKELIEFVAEFDTAVPTLNTTNPEGESLYAVSVPNSMITFTKRINSVKDLNELYKMYPELQTSTYFQSSDIINRLFTKEGVRNQDVSIELNNYVGNDTKSTRSLSDLEKTIYDFNNLYKYGYADISRTASSSTYYSFEYKNKNNNIINKYQKATDTALSSQSILKFLSYLKAETKNKEFYLFEDILSKEQKDKLLSLSDSDLETLFSNDDNLEFRLTRYINSINTYLIQTTNDYVNKLKSYKLIEGENSNLTLTEEGQLIIDDVTPIYEIAYSNVINNMINNIEAAIIYGGDLRDFKDAFNKRYKAFISTGDNLSTSSSAVSFLENSFKSYNSVIDYVLGKQYSTSRIITNRFNTKTLKENVKNSDFLDDMFSNLDLSKEEKAIFEEAYNNMKIGDGQGLCTIEAYKEFVTRAYGWDEYKDMAYDYEVLTAQMLYGKTKEEREEALIDRDDLEKEMIKKGVEKFALPPLKFQYAGLVRNKSGKTAIDKFSIRPLLPSSLSKDEFILLKEMYAKNIQYSMYESATKTYKGEKNSKGEYETLEKYIEYAKIQIAIDDKVKKEGGWATQFRKLLFTSLFVDGKAANPDIALLFKEYLSLLKEVNDANKDILFTKLGIEIDVNEDGEANVTIKDYKKLINNIQSELRRRGEDETAISYEHLSNKPFNILDVTGKHALINDIIFGLFDKNLRVFKVKGGDYIQISNAMHDKLNFYTLNEEKTKINKAEVRIGLQGEFVKLLNLKHPKDGKRIGNLERLNWLLKNDKDFVKLNEKSLTITGYRIPTQGINSIEILTIKEFLPFTSGNVIQLYDEIVAKSGSDFDIDKLRLFFPNLSNNGLFIDESVLDDLQAKIKELEEKYKGINEVVESDEEFDITKIDFEKLKTQMFSKESKEMSKEDLENLIEKTLKEYNDLSSSKKEMRINKLLILFNNVLTNPIIYKNLVTPNSPYIVKNAIEDFYENTLRDISFDEKSKYPKGMDIFNINVKAEVNKAMTVFKDLLGIFAKTNTAHQLSLQNKLEINELYNYDSRANVFQSEVVLGLLTKKERANILKNETISLHGSFIKLNSKDETLVEINEVFSAGITSTVDIEGNKFFSLSGINYSNINSFIFLVKTQTPLDRILKFINTDVYKALDLFMANGLSLNKSFQLFDNRLRKEYTDDFIKGIKQSLKDNPITDEELDAYYKIKQGIEEGDLTNTKFRIFYYAQMLNDYAQELSSFYEFFSQDTTKVQNSFDNMGKRADEDKITKKGFIKNTSFLRYKDNSIISEFYKNQSFSANLAEIVLPILNNKKLLDKILNNYLDGDNYIINNIKYKDSKDILRLKTIKTLQNDYISNIIQNFGEIEGISIIDKINDALYTTNKNESFSDMFLSFKSLFPENYKKLSNDFKIIDNIVPTLYQISDDLIINNVYILKEIGQNKEEISHYLDNMNSFLDLDKSYFLSESSFSQKDILEYFEEMRDKLYLLGIAQGFGKKLYNFENLVPNRFKMDIYSKAANKYLELSTKEFSKFTESFIRMFVYNNPSLITTDGSLEFPEQINKDLEARFKNYTSKLTNNNLIQSNNVDVKDYYDGYDTIDPNLELLPISESVNTNNNQNTQVQDNNSLDASQKVNIPLVEIEKAATSMVKDNNFKNINTKEQALVYINEVLNSNNQTRITGLINYIKNCI